MVRYGSILGLICIVAAGFLAGINALTNSRIIAQAQAEEEAGLKEVVPLAAHFEAAKSGEKTLYYKAHDKEARLVGVAFKALAKGYSSDIETLVGMSPDGTILAIKILNQNETPGLGSRISGAEFTSQFKNKNDLSNIQAITGATISSRAVIDSVKSKAEEIKQLMTNDKIQSTK